MNYDAENWYWVVGGDESRVWSSAAGAYCPASDTAFAAWMDEGGIPSRIASEAELCEVINAPVLKAIEAAESRQARPLREIALSSAPTATPRRAVATARLAELDSEIATLRASLISEPLA